MLALSTFNGGLDARFCKALKLYMKITGDNIDCKCLFKTNGCGEFIF